MHVAAEKSDRPTEQNHELLSHSKSRAPPDTVEPPTKPAKSSDQHDSSKDKLEVSDEDSDTNSAANKVSVFPACTRRQNGKEFAAASKLLYLKQSQQTVEDDQPSSDTSEPAKENPPLPQPVSAKATKKTKYPSIIKIASKDSKLETETEKHSRSIKGLKKGMEQANIKVASLEQTVASQARELGSMKQSKAQIKSEIEHLKSELERLKEAKGEEQADLARNYYSNGFTEINILKGGLEYLMGAYNSVFRRVSHLEFKNAQPHYQRQYEPHLRR